MAKLHFKLVVLVFVVGLIFFPGLIFSQTSTESDTSKLLALVIGNSNYSGNFLPGPDNDAIDIAKVLSGLGFEISNSENITNLDRASMHKVISAFIDKVNKDTIAIVYYSGHGLEDSGENFLVPLDARLNSYGDLDSQLVSLNKLLTRLSQREARTKIVILDACRNMPQALRYKSLVEIGGLAEVKDLRPGTRVIYAASPESTAMSAPEGQRNSVFTAAFLQAIQEKYSTFDDILNRAAQLTLIATNNKQYPWSSGNLGMSFRVSPQNLMNPLSQEQTELLPSSQDLKDTSISPDCEVVTERVMLNGVITWRKICI